MVHGSPFFYKLGLPASSCFIFTVIKCVCRASSRPQRGLPVGYKLGCPVPGIEQDRKGGSAPLETKFRILKQHVK